VRQGQHSCKPQLCSLTLNGRVVQTRPQAAASCWAACCGQRAAGRRCPSRCACVLQVALDLGRRKPC
jgi:hypothetical protein